MSELATQYDPSGLEPEIYRQWQEARAFAARPDDREGRYVIMMPLPNVTGALHMGHAMDNVMQDLLTRWHRMRGDNTLWMAGTDHAGIATQAVVETRLLELEGKTRHDVGREGLVERIWEWKDQYQSRIVSQQQAMGCSCDWDRQRFTMDDVCARAVSWTFFALFRDGLIFRGNRLVNWDCHLHTAVSDDEVYHESVKGHFWHLRYPIIDAADGELGEGEPTHVVVATTRPETMLGDTAVAVHPDPKTELERLIGEAREKLEAAGAKDRPAAEEELARLEARRTSHLPQLEKLAAMARAGRKVRLPLLDREIPLICDEWAKPGLGSGCVKITPGHDPNDYEVWGRHADTIGIINILEENGTLNANAGPYQGQDRFVARKSVVDDLEKQGLLEQVEDRDVEVGHSDRSKTPIEPYISLQWFVAMGDVEGGVVLGRGTEKEFTSPGLAQAAIDAVRGDWKSATGRKLQFHPDPVRYGNTYLNWLDEKRDWCISRQLWWGHRIPIWAAPYTEELLTTLASDLGRDDLVVRLSQADGTSQPITSAADRPTDDAEHTILVCLRDPNAQKEDVTRLEGLGLERDTDVLDTWFSSGIWPHSTLGWPDPATARIDDGQSALASENGHPNALDYYYPGSCLVTGRDIINLWVARMVFMGLYNLGDLPFTDVFLHATILDGKGERMSKSKGNGIDPVDIIERYGTDAMRYVICEIQTGSQDVRLPVQAVSPFTGNEIDLATAKHGQTRFTYLCPETGQEFDVLGSMPDLPSAKLVSERFEIGRNFCNKLWNAARFALLNLESTSFEPRKLDDLADEDRWVLSRLAKAIAEIDLQLEAYNPSAAVAAAREFFWSELCDWYLEIIKPRLRDEEAAALPRQVLAVVIDRVLRLLHPFVPFITESIWAKLGELAPKRGIHDALECPPLIVHAPWPQAPAAWNDDALESRFEFQQRVVKGIRDIRAKYTVAPRDTVPVRIRADGDAAATLMAGTDMIRHLGVLESLEISADVEPSQDAASAVVGEAEIFVYGVIDIEKEKARLLKQREKLLSGIGGARKKLSNESFVSRAKTEVVEREKERLEEMEAQLIKVDEQVKRLEG